MNAEASRLRQRLQDDSNAFESLEHYRRHVLQHLKLKAVVKESHGAPVESVLYNHTHTDCSNLFITVGANQATVYDDEHMGDHIGVVTHFTNVPTDHSPGGNLTTATWLNADTWTQHPYGDACVAVSGEDGMISIISVVEARVIKLLKGHARGVADVTASAASRPELLASLSKDGKILLWDVVSEECLSSITMSDATCLTLKPDGDGIVCGTSRGRLVQCDIDESAEGKLQFNEHGRTQLQPASSAGSSSSYHSEAVDCVKFLSPHRLATKSVDGKMFVWCYPSMQCSAGWKIPGCSYRLGTSLRCSFSSTPDGMFIAAGNSSGTCYVFDARDGSRITTVSAIRVSAPVRACALSHDCRHLLAAVGNGFLFRFEYVASRDNDQGDVGGDETPCKDTESPSEGEKENTDGNTNNSDA